MNTIQYVKNLRKTIQDAGSITLTHTADSALALIELELAQGVVYRSKVVHDPTHGPSVEFDTSRVSLATSGYSTGVSKLSDTEIEALKTPGQIFAMPREPSIVEDVKRLTRERDRFERKLQRAVRTIKELSATNDALSSEMNRLLIQRNDLIAREDDTLPNNAELRDIAVETDQLFKGFAP